MADEPLTHREAEALTLSIRDLTSSIDTLRGDIASTYVRKDVYEAEKREMQKEIGEHSAWILWGQRLALGLLFTALIGLVLYQGGLTGLTSK